MLANAYLIVRSWLRLLLEHGLRFQAEVRSVLPGSDIDEAEQRALRKAETMLTPLLASSTLASTLYGLPPTFDDLR
ncbi:hypothetical protein [uncultured Hymenobacter sp.]|uniref:hypothetical protein n=1 Tax=uncultured Hymenobacter sp. TaxID=170016 RepID=UPI0035CB1B9C